MTAAARHGPATVEDLLRLPGEVAAEIIDGELVEKAIGSFERGAAQGALGQLLEPFNRRPGGRHPGGWRLALGVDVQYEETQIYRHDVVGWRRETTPERPSGKPVRIRPDWVAEVLSTSNAGNDLVKKLRTLHRHGVPHYWIVDPVHRTLTVMRWTADGYLNAVTASEEDVVRAEPFDAIELRVGVLFGGDPDDE
ncbi:Uma2 family endonuclease [Polyangium aurulentum]|uniref:Uma2 family endonuclease n=1 Tax=Polyangium aurulentum TaxID=2567896 RepID=UPI0010AE6F6D|nr:Uma2 family endonuclease [Polyangium aurulentum]UQA55545.1 Uma2 family endonuclease [Polyangium aurulentum]